MVWGCHGDARKSACGNHLKYDSELGTTFSTLCREGIRTYQNGGISLFPPSGLSTCGPLRELLTMLSCSASHVPHTPQKSKTEMVMDGGRVAMGSPIHHPNQVNYTGPTRILLGHGPWLPGLLHMELHLLTTATTTRLRVLPENAGVYLL